MARCVDAAGGEDVAHCVDAAGGEDVALVDEVDGGADNTGGKKGFSLSTDTVHGLPDLKTKNVFSCLSRTS